MTRKPDPVEQALDRLSALRHEAATPATVAELKTFLKNRSNLVVAKAAKIAGELRTADLAPELVAAFHRLMKSPEKLDKGCAATTEIASALHELDYVEPDVYLQGIHHVQMEGAFGPPVDTAAKLRAVSALGLARTRYPHARVGAVRALASNGGEAGALLLKLKLLAGEDEPDVLAECFSGLLDCAPQRSLPLVATYIDSEQEDVAEAALLAIGSSRLPEALELLKTKSREGVPVALRKALLLAIAMIRSEEAIEFLLSVLRDGTLQIARHAVTALAMFRTNEKVRASVEAAVLQHNDQALSELFRQEF